jgi:hypothetical protein
MLFLVRYLMKLRALPLALLRLLQVENWALRASIPQVSSCSAMGFVSVLQCRLLLAAVRTGIGAHMQGNSTAHGFTMTCLPSDCVTNSAGTQLKPSKLQMCASTGWWRQLWW